jgi:hypothetical protein
MRGYVGDKFCNLSRVTLVSFESDRFDALNLEITHNRLGLRGGHGITDGDISAFGRESPCRRRSNAA